MDMNFKDNLYNTVLNHMADENFGTSNLASLLGLSTSQTLRKVKATTGKSVNQYIREIKLTEAAKLIRETELTSAEIAYKVGFSSPSYFNKTFRKHFGITPGAYKAQEAIQKENGFIKDGIEASKPTSIGKKSAKHNVIIVGSILVLLLATMSYYSYKNSDNATISETSITAINDKSIAILPFKNLSSNSENQYFADGVMEVILNHLTSIDELKVVSRTSTQQYRETVKTIPEIAKELGVSYILEGSVQKNKDKIRIITQLIDAKNDKHILSTDIERDYKDIFELQTIIAKQISEELNAELSEVERFQIEKIPTNSLEAYNLYLRGVHFMRNGLVKKGIPYFKQAIEKDPEFANAYSELGMTYEILVAKGIFFHDDYLLKSKELAQKAIALDSSLGQPHHQLATILYRHDYNWKAAEERFLIAIDIEPKNPFTYLLYAKFLSCIGRIKESREKLDKALQIDPTYYGTYFESATYYYYLGDYEKALAENKKGLDVMFKAEKTNWLNFNIYIAQNQFDKAVLELQKLYDGKTSIEIGEIYRQSGIKGVYKWLIKVNSKSENYNTPYFLAQLYAFVGEHERALEQLEKSFEMKISSLASINRDPYFNNLRLHPRFKKILQKMNLPD